MKCPYCPDFECTKCLFCTLKQYDGITLNTRRKDHIENHKHFSIYDDYYKRGEAWTNKTK